MMSIDRKELVSLHNPVLHDFVTDSPLTVGNGEFAFTADVTGLQTFYELYEEPLPLCTQAQWGWHTTPYSQEIPRRTREELVFTPYDTYGRTVGYAKNRYEGNEEVYDWLRVNPHRLNLAAIGFVFTAEDGRRARPGDITAVRQTLDLYTGTLYSEFLAFGVPCRVKTACHPSLDVLAVELTSELCGQGRAAIELRLPYGSPHKSASDWHAPERHQSVLSGSAPLFHIERTLDDDRYQVAVRAEEATLAQEEAHRFTLRTEKLCACIGFSQSSIHSLPAPQEVFAAAVAHWQDHWEKGAIVRLNRSRDTRALELERRIILSQYLTAVQCAGSVPPQETGLTCNSWYGKFHLEMHLWHAAHFYFWGRTDLLERSLGWYIDHLSDAQALAQSQGYRGARWPKMLASDGVDTPSAIAPLLIWQQPHILCFVEWCYREHSDEQTLAQYAQIVFETAEFMADYAHYDEQTGRYVLGPPVIPAQENHAPETCINPAYELEYWRFGLQIAQAWKKRLGLPIEPKWQDIIERIALPAIGEGVYLAHENCPDTFERFGHDHPSMLCAYGLLPSERIDPKTMERTMDRVLDQWDFPSMWGWDFGVIAMTATLLGRPETAVEILLRVSHKNDYVASGHNRQRSRRDLPLYLPGNGSLLLAIAMMAAGYEGCDKPAPGFPADGSWTVEAEGLRPFWL